ncbi:hypothetical protein P3342_004213 [Pyrenophora teres f. teres]|nr:hypothetical protein P3342_004213 [Pyrenophora teres f. teres]
MKPAESMGEYIARFNVGTSALRWNDTLKIQFMRHRLPVWWRDMTAMKVLEADITYLGFCQTLRLLEQSNPPRTTTTGNCSGGGGGGGGNKSTLSNTNRNNGSGSGSGPRGRSDIQVKVLRHLNRCFNCLKGTIAIRLWAATVLGSLSPPSIVTPKFRTHSRRQLPTTVCRSESQLAPRSRRRSWRHFDLQLLPTFGKRLVPGDSRPRDLPA